MGLYQGHLPGGGVFCPTTSPLEPGATVVVDLACKALPNRVLIRGKVVSWRPALPRRRVRAGALVQFDADESSKRDFVLDILGGKRAPTPKRRHTRLPVALAAQVRVSGAGPVEAEVREISVSGALLAGIPQPAIGTDVVVSLDPPGAATPMDISARVLYHAGSEGTGLKFLFREGGGSRRLRELVRRLKAS